MAGAAVVLGFALLMTVASMATEGVLASGAVTGSGVLVSLAATALAVRQHNARLDRTGGAAPHR